MRRVMSLMRRARCMVESVRVRREQMQEIIYTEDMTA
jgi:hypothetical protein